MLAFGWRQETEDEAGLNQAWLLAEQQTAATPPEYSEDNMSRRRDTKGGIQC